MTQHDDAYPIIANAIGKRIRDVTGIDGTVMGDFVLRDFVASSVVPDVRIDSRLQKMPASEFFRQKYGDSHSITTARTHRFYQFTIVLFSTFLVIELERNRTNTCFVVLHPPPEKISELALPEPLAAEIVMTTFMAAVLGQPEGVIEVSKELRLLLEGLQLLPATRYVDSPARDAGRTNDIPTTNAPEKQRLKDDENSSEGKIRHWMKRLFGKSAGPTTALDRLDELANTLIVPGYRRLAAQHGCAPTQSTSDHEIIEIYKRVGTAFREAADTRGELIPTGTLNCIVFHFLQTKETGGDELLESHLAYEVKKYIQDGLRADYRHELSLF